MVKIHSIFLIFNNKTHKLILGAIGIDAVAKQAKSLVFLSGANGLGIEIAKNIVLSGSTLESTPKSWSRLPTLRLEARVELDLACRGAATLQTAETLKEAPQHAAV